MVGNLCDVCQIGKQTRVSFNLFLFCFYKQTHWFSPLKSLWLLKDLDSNRQLLQLCYYRHVSLKIQAKRNSMKNDALRNAKCKKHLLISFKWEVSTNVISMICKNHKIRITTSSKHIQNIERTSNKGLSRKDMCVDQFVSYQKRLSIFSKPIS